MPDFLSTHNERVDAAGNVTYDFEGHIAADGIDLDATSRGAPADDRSVRWLRAVDGAVVARVFGYDEAFVPPESGLGAEAIAPSDASRAEAFLRSDRRSGGRQAEVVAAYHGDRVAGKARLLARARRDDGTGTRELVVLDGAGASDFLRASDTPEGWHVVGGAGEPAFQNAWVNFGASGVMSFRRDQLGRIHLAGIVKSGALPGAIFTLPAGYRPANEVRAAVISNGAAAWLTVLNNGEVRAQNGSNVWFHAKASFWTDE